MTTPTDKEVMQQALEALKDALSVCRSVSTCKTRRTREDGVTMYAQTEEWCRWVEDEVGPKVDAAGDALIAALAEQAQPVERQAQPAQEPRVDFVDAWNCRHSLSIEQAAEELRQWENEWPGGLEEVASAIERLKKAAPPAPQPLTELPPLLPKTPPPGLLMSMAMRYDHGIGLPGYYDGESMAWPKESRVTHAQRLDATLTTMRQLYEEVSGHGFYSPAKEDEYRAIERRVLGEGKP